MIRETYTIIGVRNGEQIEPNFLVYGEKEKRDRILEEYVERIKLWMGEDDAIGEIQIKVRR